MSKKHMPDNVEVGNVITFEPQIEQGSDLTPQVTNTGTKEELTDAIDLANMDVSYTPEAKTRIMTLAQSDQRRGYLIATIVTGEQNKHHLSPEEANALMSALDSDPEVLRSYIGTVGGDYDLVKDTDVSHLTASDTPVLAVGVRRAAAAALVGLATVLYSCTPKDPNPNPIEQVDNRPETEKYTVDQWVAKENVKLESPVSGTNGSLVMKYKVVAVNGLYKLQPDILIVKKDVIPMAEKVMQTSGQPAENMAVYVAFANPQNSNTGQWFEIDYPDFLDISDEVLASKLKVRTPGSNDLFLNYAPGTQMKVTIRVSVRQDILDELKKQGIATTENQENFYDHRLISINIGK